MFRHVLLVLLVNKSVQNYILLESLRPKRSENRFFCSHFGYVSQVMSYENMANLTDLGQIFHVRGYNFRCL